jgi:hypothetical protein
MISLEENSPCFGILLTLNCNFTKVPSQFPAIYWQTSCLNPYYSVPSIFPSSMPSHSMPTTHYSPYVQQYTISPFTPTRLERISTPPIQSCKYCTTTYICPHHFKFSILAYYFCCHFCYCIHTFPPTSSRRRLFYSH